MLVHFVVWVFASSRYALLAAFEGCFTLWSYFLLNTDFNSYISALSGALLDSKSDKQRLIASNNSTQMPFPSTLAS